MEVEGLLVFKWLVSPLHNGYRKGGQILGKGLRT